MLTKPRIDWIERGIDHIIQFAEKWKISLNHNKTEAILFGRKRLNRNFIEPGQHRVPLKPSITYLGVTIDRNLTFHQVSPNNDLAISILLLDHTADCRYETA